MAQSILFNIVEKILVSLGQDALQDLKSSWGAKRDLEKLEDTLRFIRARVHDAERRHEEESSEVIKEWLGRLRLLLYRADDLFDEVHTISCRRQRADKSKLANKVRIVFSNSNPFGFNRKIAQQIKSIREELDRLKSEMDGLNLRVCLTDQEPISRFVFERETISFVQADTVIGRDADKNNILDMLFDPKYAEESVTVIPIVAFGGFGKTTLAQLVFNDERVQKEFDIAKWACVPEINDQKKVLGEISRALTGMSNHDLSKDQLQSKIRIAVKDKKFLLVLDDIWDESRDRWLDLLSLLKCGNRGSKIIVTTRSDVVATIVGTIPNAYKLGLLTPEESWNLFRMLAFRKGQEESNPNFAVIGKEIVRNCGNVPLAIRVVGSLLYSKPTEKEWELFRDAQVSKAKITDIDIDDIMPVLKLSYDYLPSELKRCFAYCSLFPKDYLFWNTELVRLWMAQGYIEMEDVGDKYFLELVRRNLFQVGTLNLFDCGWRKDTSEVIYCKMHDLVHDLAQRVAGDESSVVDGLGAQFTNRLLHVNCAQFNFDPKSLLVAKSLRSLLMRNNNLPETTNEEVLEFRSLRVLKFIMVNVVPDSINRLTHLRYLNLSFSDIEFLPSGITRLYNLKSLNLDYCRKLKELPRGFSKLVNLRHLGTQDCPLTEMPPHFGRLTSLRELNRFIVGENNGLDTLGDLNLRGELEIEFCRWRTNTVIEAQAVNLKEKKQLTSLKFRFQYKGDQPAVATKDELLLESLHLPPSLKRVEFSGLLGTSFPRGMLFELPKLVTIQILCCDSCQALPLFSRLPLLKTLLLSGLVALEYVEVDDVMISNEAFFPVLESLTLFHMQKLKRWSKVEEEASLHRGQCYVFPRLRTLTITMCRKLMTIPFMPQLESLDVHYIHEELLKSILTSLSSTSSPPTLQYLSMDSVEPIKSLNLKYISDGIQCLSALENLTIQKCKDLDAWDEIDGVSAWEGLKSLRTLELSHIDKLELLPRGIGCLSTLEHLIIKGLPDLTALPQQIVGLSQLQSLDISCCPKLTTLPETVHGLTSLQKLTIHACPNLEKRCKRPDGDCWPLIQHIPTISFDSSMFSISSRLRRLLMSI